MAVSKGSAAFVGQLFGILLLASCSSLDPSLCPYELGYNPRFSDDGSQLWCYKGAESFQVDADGTNALALREVGNSAKELTIAAFTFAEDLFDEFTDKDAIFYLPDGTPIIHGDQRLGPSFLFTFKFQQSVDINGAYDVSNFEYLGGDPAEVHVTWKIFTIEFEVRFDSIFKQNDEEGTKVWQQYILRSSEFSYP